MNYTLQKIAILLLLLPLAVAAKEPVGYYGAANGKSGAALKTALHGSIKGHTERTYKELWTDFVRTDSRADGKVWDMYSNCTFTWGTHQDKGAGGGAECQFYNREHSFPKSWFDDGYPMYTDLFHLIPTDKYVNGKRGNMPYGEVGSGAQTFGNGSKIGACSFAGCTGTVFEPADEYKGDFARTYFYMATRYEDVVAGWYANAEAKPMLNGTAHPAFQAWAVSLLLKWHRQDTVSQKELARNDSIYEIQRNRNPYIDHPELAEYIWGDSTAYTWSRGGEPEPDTTATAVASLSGSAGVTLYPNPVINGELKVENGEFSTLNSQFSIEIYSIAGALVLTQEATGELTTVNVSALPGGTYLLKHGKRTTKFVKQ